MTTRVIDHTPTRVLVTAFNAFGGMTTNASELVVRALAPHAAPPHVELRTMVLRTEYAQAGDAVVAAIREFRPHAVIGCGLAVDRTLRLERLARNRDECPECDNAGEIHEDAPIAAGGPDHYPATVPYDRLAAAFDQVGVPYVFSDDAGGFLCNHVFYRACHEIARGRTKSLCGFIHIPPIAGSPAEPGLPFGLLLDALGACIAVAADAVARERAASTLDPHRGS
jgi:pyroglutamyl-peptidase